MTITRKHILSLLAAAGGFFLSATEAVGAVEAASADGIEVSLASDRATATLSFPMVTSDRAIYLAYGYADGGCETSKWDHVVKFADVASGEAGCTAALPAEAQRAGVRMRFLMDKADFSSASYVRQDDLLGQWDAIDGTATAEGWRDLKGGAPLLWNGTPSFDERSVTLNGSTSLNNAVTGLKDALAGKAFTIQMMMHAEKLSEWVAYQTLFRLGGTANRSLYLDVRRQTDSGKQHGSYTFGGLQFRETGWQGRSTILAPNDFFDQDVLVTVTVDSSGAHLWANDAAEPLHTTVGGTAAPAADDVNIFGNNKANCYPGKIYGIRLYKRTLTADEIAANCRVDFARYASQAARCSKLVEIGHDIAADVSSDWSKASFAFASSTKVRAIYIAYGPTDAGHASADWAHCVKLADVPADTTSLADVALPSDLKASAENRYARFLMDSSLGTYDYVQEGLMAMWDAVENAGRGVHDADAAKWKDLVGSSDLSLNGTPVFNPDSVTLANKSAFDGTVNGIASAFQHSGFTVQLMMRPTERPSAAYCGVVHIGPGGANRQLILDTRKQAGQNSWYSFAGLQFREANWQDRSIVQPENDYVGKNVEMTVTVDERGANLWFDDAAAPHFTTEGGDANSTSDEFHIGREVSGAYYPMVLYGARLYSRPLTAAEIARNTAVDRERVEQVFVSATPSYMLPAHPFTATVNRGKWMSATFTPTHRPRKLIFAWDTEDRGETLADWANSVVLTDVPADAWKLEKVALPADRGNASAGRFFLEPDYVQDGLYAQWDAEYNGNGGQHDENPPSWVDLVGGQELSSVNTSVFDEKSVALTGENYFKGEVSGVAQLFKDKSFTVQLACRPGDFVKSAAALYFGQDSKERTLGLDQRKESAQSTNYTFGAVQYLESGWNNRSMIGEKSDYFGKDVLVTVTTDSSGAHLWFDNASSAFFTTVGGSLVPSTDWFYLGHYAGGNTFKMTVYGVRIYNRTLTADEIATNWDVDNGRFFGGAPKFEVSEVQDISLPGFKIIIR